MGTQTDNKKAVPAIQAQIASTDKFLVSYQLHKQLEETPEVDEIVVCSTKAEDDAARAECAKLVSPFDEEIKSGEVRLLGDIETPTYVLVVRRWDETSWLVIPFSPYSYPATDTELKMKTDGGLRLRVVQLWNAFSLLTDTLKKSWLVNTLSEDERLDALTAWQWTVGVADLTDDQIARTGLPITNRKDIRVEYRKAEISKFKKLLFNDLVASGFFDD